MTRFARAKGSKASNERNPEEAMTWGEMKQQLLDKNKEVEDAQKRKESDAQRAANYKCFLNDLEESKSKDVQWADFPGTVPNTKKAKKSKPAETITNGQSLEQIASSSEEVEKQPEKDDDDAPAECSSKIQHEEVKITKKPKIKGKKPLKIQIEGSDISTSQDNPPNSGLKRKREDKKNGPNKNKPSKAPMAVKKPESELTEEDKKKLERKKQKRIRQLEKKKKAKQERLKQIELNVGENPPEILNNNQDKSPFKKFDQPITKQFNQKQAKKFDKNEEKPERRKKLQDSMVINGKEVAIAYVDGFPIKKEDAERIQQLRKQMISKGLPRSEIKIALKLERRKAEKAFTREKKKVCFYCRKSGHNLSECPDVGNKELAESSGTGICYKCGSTEHTHFECKVTKGDHFKFAECFICHEQGHISRQCPDNARGLYPKGGACRACGDVTHLRRDCPQFQAQQNKEQGNVQIETLDGSNPDNLDSNSYDRNNSLDVNKKPNKIIKF